MAQYVTAPAMMPSRTARGFSLGFAREVYAAAAEVFGVELAAVESTSHVYEVARTRQAAWLVMYESTPASLSKIALASKRDHSTVHHGLRMARQRVASDRTYAEKVMQLWAAIAQDGREMGRAA